MEGEIEKQTKELFKKNNLEILVKFGDGGFNFLSKDEAERVLKNVNLKGMEVTFDEDMKNRQNLIEYSLVLLNNPTELKRIFVFSRFSERFNNDPPKPSVSQKSSASVEKVNISIEEAEDIIEFAKMQHQRIFKKHEIITEEDFEKLYLKYIVEMIDQNQNEEKVRKIMIDTFENIGKIFMGNITSYIAEFKQTIPRLTLQFNKILSEK